MQTTTKPAAQSTVAKPAKLETQVIGGRQCVKFNGTWIGIE